MRTASAPPQGGAFPATWISGNSCATDPEFQVHAYNENLYIIRQSKCHTHEAPFLYLIFGSERVLLMDTGATAQLDVWSVVERVIEDWLQRNGQTSTRLIVAHTHGHADHIAADSQFVGKPYVEKIVGHSIGAVTQFWGFANYPHDTPTIDLGDRVLDVLGTPGHHPVSVSLYDRETHLLLTGDIVYPGHLFVFSQAEWQDFKESLLRLARFATLRPVEWLLGCHIEFSTTPFQPYAWGALQHPNERALQFHPLELREIYLAAASMGSTPQCTIFDEFVIHPVYICGIFWNG